MSEESEEISFEKWMKDREKAMREQADDIKNSNKPLLRLPRLWIYEGFQALCDEIADLYKALSFIYEVIYENDKELAQHLKALLGLTGKATKKDIAERAKELGKLNQEFINSLNKRKTISSGKEERIYERFYDR